MKTLAEQITSVKREIGMRERVYPNLIQRGKLTLDQANGEIDAMRSVLITLKALLPPEPVQTTMELSS